MTDFKLPDNRIRNGFLDDEQNAYKFYDEKKARATEIIHQLLSLTYGYDNLTETNNDWGHGHLLEILEMFMIRHKNFSRSDFAEDLQTVIFQFSMTHDETQREWRKKIFTERGLDDDGEPLPAEAEKQEAKEPPNILDLSSQTTAEDGCIDLAKHISAVLNDKQTPESLKIVIANGISDLGRGDKELAEFTDSAEYISKVLCQEASNE